MSWKGRGKPGRRSLAKHASRYANVSKSTFFVCVDSPASANEPLIVPVLGNLREEKEDECLVAE